MHHKRNFATLYLDMTAMRTATYLDISRLKWIYEILTSP